MKLDNGPRHAPMRHLRRQPEPLLRTRTEDLVPLKKPGWSVHSIRIALLVSGIVLLAVAVIVFKMMV